jgi:predicted RNA-binding Zn-ribbon protein involved in translation (DUF1610 family)
MRPPSYFEPPKPCPVCQVAMQVDKTAFAVVHQCARCGVVITVANPSRDRDGPAR